MAVLQGGVSGVVQDVNADHEALVALTQDPTKAGVVRITNTDGRDIDTTENNYLRVSTSALVLYEQVDGNTINTNLWNPYVVSGMTIVQASGFITLNAGNSVASGNYAILTSIKSIPLYGSLPLLVEINAKTLNLPEANAVVELGIGIAAGVAAPTDGAFFRWSATGGFYAVINYGGSETSSANLGGQTFTDNSGDSINLPPTTIGVHLYAIEIVEDHVIFLIDDIEVADVSIPAGQAYPVNSGRQTLLARVYNSGTAPLAPQLSIGQVTVKQEDLYQNKTWAETLSVMGRNAYQHPTTYGATANFTNSTNPTSGTLSNTAAGYTTLGGRFQFAAVAGAQTDYALFGFQVPAGYQFFCTGIDIETVVTGVAVVTATILEWSVGVNSSAVSLATADGVGTWGPRRTGLGLQTFLALAAVANQATDIARRFPVPLVVDSGRYFHVILQIPNGAATASLVFRGLVSVQGYFE